MELIEIASSYLNNRKQFVCLIIHSDIQIVQCGIPQGSVLGHFLLIWQMQYFSVSGNDFVCWWHKVFACRNYPIALYAMVNRELIELETWFHANRLSLNVNITKLMVFTSRKINESPAITIQKKKWMSSFNTVFGCSNWWKKHKWNCHTECIKQKLTRSITIIAMASAFYDSALFIFLLYITYCVESWITVYNCHINPLIVAWKKALF